MKFIKKLITIRFILRTLQFWGPYSWAGIKVDYVSPDLFEIRTRLKTSLWNQNYFGTHFGGSLYAMCDPFYMFILLEKMEKDHIIWDKAAEIDFIKAIREPVYATFKITPEQVEDLKKQCLETFKIYPQFDLEIKTKSGEVVAKVKKTVYLRRKDAKERFAHIKPKS